MKKIKNLSLSFISKVVLSVLILMSTITSCTKDEIDTFKGLAVGSTAPEFSLLSLDSADLLLSDYEGKVVLLFFFDAQSDICKGSSYEIDEMNLDLSESHSDFQVLGLDKSNSSRSIVQSFQEENLLTYPLLLNAAEIATAYNTTTNRIMVIDKMGKIAFTGTKSSSVDLAAAKIIMIALLEAPSIQNN